MRKKEFTSPVDTLSGEFVMVSFPSPLCTALLLAHPLNYNPSGPGTGLCMAELILDGEVTSANIDSLGL